MGNQYHKFKEEKIHLLKLKNEYDQLQKDIFNYKEYTKRCTNKPLLPSQLVEKREEVFKEISKLTRKLRKQGVMV